MTPGAGSRSLTEAEDRWVRSAKYSNSVWHILQHPDTGVWFLISPDREPAGAATRIEDLVPLYNFHWRSNRPTWEPPVSRRPASRPRATLDDVL